MFAKKLPSNRPPIWTFPLREWQTQVFEQYVKSEARDFLAVATPGAGKTAVALCIAHYLLTTDQIDMVIIVCPTDHLRKQWSEASHGKTGEIAEFEQFIDFITTDPLEGLGTSLETLKQLVAHDAEMSEKLDHVVKDLLPPIAKHGGDRSKEQGDNITLHNRRGSDPDYILMRLKRDRPDLAERVMLGKKRGGLSANQAAIEAGFVKPRAGMAIDSVVSVARALKKRFSREQLDELIALLTDGSAP